MVTRDRKAHVHIPSVAALDAPRDTCRGRHNRLGQPGMEALRGCLSAAVHLSELRVG